MIQSFDQVIELFSKVCRYLQQLLALVSYLKYSNLKDPLSRHVIFDTTVSFELGVDWFRIVTVFACIVKTTWSNLVILSGWPNLFKWCVYVWILGYIYSVLFM